MHRVDAVKRLLEQLKADLLEREGAVMTGAGEPTREALEDFYRRVRGLQLGYRALSPEEARDRLDALKDEWTYTWQSYCDTTSDAYGQYMCVKIVQTLADIEAGLMRGEAGTKECDGVNWALGIIMDKLIARMGGYDAPERAWEWAADAANRHADELERYQEELKSQGLSCGDIWARLDSRAETIADGIRIPDNIYKDVNIPWQ